MYVVHSKGQRLHACYLLYRIWWASVLGRVGNNGTWVAKMTVSQETF